MQGALIAIAGGAILPYSMAVFAARFGDKKDIADPGVLRELANQVGLDATEFDRGLADAGALTTIEANSDELNERGGFGVPTMFVGDSMIFGSDRMPLVEFSLGQASERTFVLPGHHG